MKGVVNKLINGINRWSRELRDLGKEEATKVVENLRMGKPVSGELAARIMVRFPWVEEAERQFADGLKLMDRVVRYLFVVGPYRSGKSQLKEYLSWLARKEGKVLVVKHDFGLRQNPVSLLRSISEAVKEQISMARDERAAHDMARLLEDVTPSPMSDEGDAKDTTEALNEVILPTAIDIFGGVNIHLDEFEKLRDPELLYKWIDLLTTIHDKFNKGIFAVFYLTGDDLRRLREDQRTERFLSFIREKVPLRETYGEMLPEGFGRLAALVERKFGSYFRSEESLLASELIATAYHRLSRETTLSEANTSMIDVLDSLKQIGTKIDVARFMPDSPVFLKLGFPHKDLGDRFESFAKIALSKLATGFEMDGKPIEVSFNPDPVECRRGRRKKRSDGYLEIKTVDDTGETKVLGRIPVEIKTAEVRGLVGDVKILANCGLMLIMTVKDPEDSQKVVREILEKAKVPEEVPLKIVLYPEKFAIIASLSMEEEGLLKDAVKIFLSLWDLDSISYDLAHYVMTEREADVLDVKIESGMKPDLRSLIALAVVEELESMKKWKLKRVIEDSVAKAVKRKNIEANKEVIKELIEEILDKLAGEGLINFGSQRWKGKREIKITKSGDKWDSSRAKEVLGVR